MPAAGNRVPDTNSAAADHSLPAAKPINFGTFELDLRSGELRKDGRKIKLQGQPVQILMALLEHPGEIVTREELRQRLWPSDTFVDFEHNLNSAVKRLREAVGDSADNPRFIETLPRHGYRFIAPVAELGRTARRPQVSTRTLWLAGLVGVMIVGLVLGLYVRGWRQRLLGQVHTVPIQSVAVLPLANLSGKPEEEYFADGMTEELITELGRVRNLRVISRQSVMQYKGTMTSLSQIANELHVEALVQGSALRAGNRVRITTQLIRAVPEEHLWAESYERDLSDVIDLQREVARDITTQVKVTLSRQEQIRPARARPRNPEAYNAYLLARYFHQRHPDRENVEKAVSYYERAIKLDPDYAPAWAGLAILRDGQTGVLGLLPIEEGYRKMREATQRALELDPNLPEAYQALATLKLFYDQDWAGADTAFQRALALEPGNAEATLGVAWVAATLGRFEEALVLNRHAIELNPLSTAAYGDLAFHALYAGRFKEAVAACNKSLELDPAYPRVHRLLGRVYLAQSRPHEALAEMQREPDPGFRAQGLALAYHALGRDKESDVALTDLIAKFHGVAAFQIAEVYAFRGEADQAFQWLERAYSEHDSGVTETKGDPLLKSLEPDPRYPAILKKMRLPV
jgi:TolB-like protein/DNA-binding winged helix-turn-helix (wHTH) protein/tetratricopeptide (TPR) repeat protein